MRRFALVPIAFIAVTIAAITACSAQGEGGLCNLKAGNNGSDDCGNGLACQPRPSIIVNGFGICCAPAGQSTVPSCSMASTANNASPAPVAQEASVDTPIEGSADAGVADATADGGAEGSPGADAADGGTE